MSTIGPFTGEHRFLSNFFPCRVTLDGMEFRSVEHAYQAAKTLDRKARRMIQIQPKPGDAKRAGRRLAGIRPDWDGVRVGVMRDLLRQKFQDGELRHLLLATAPAGLVELNTWHDNFWGRCTCAPCGHERGDAVAKAVKNGNILGVLLMELRAEAV